MTLVDTADDELGQIAWVLLLNVSYLLCTAALCLLEMLKPEGPGSFQQPPLGHPGMRNVRCALLLLHF